MISNDEPHLYNKIEKDSELVKGGSGDGEKKLEEDN
jgi:hypothetical protein